VDDEDDDQRFTSIFRSSHAHVLAYARRRVAPDVARDVVADTFLAAWRHLDRLPADPLPWLYRAASFEIARRHRQIGRETRRLAALASPHLVEQPDIADEVASRDRWRDAFAFLSDGDREILRLVAWEHLDPSQAASILGCSVVAFKVRLHRARRRLVSHMEAENTPISEPTDRKDRAHGNGPSFPPTGDPLTTTPCTPSADSCRAGIDPSAPPTSKEARP
jgi:RNA polymerase sigma-70 factor (ECF subfamily)